MISFRISFSLICHVYADSGSNGNFNELRPNFDYHSLIPCEWWITVVCNATDHVDNSMKALSSWHL
jgi:hypothetical protein